MPKATREEQRDYQRQWMAQRRAAWLEGKACGQCGATSDLQIHHRDPAQKVTHALWSWREARRLDELAKCDILCRPCHEEHHAQQTRRHGTVSRYSKGCRCGLCTVAKARKNAAERSRRKLREAA